MRLPGRREIERLRVECQRLRVERDEARLELLRALNERNDARKARDALIQAMKERGLSTPPGPAKYETDSEPRREPEGDDEG